MAKLTVAGRLQQAAQQAAEATHARYAAVITDGLDDMPRRVVCAATDAEGIAATRHALGRSGLLDTAAGDPSTGAQLPDQQGGTIKLRASTRTRLALTIQTEDGTYGTLVVLDPLDGEFTAQDRLLVAGLAEVVAAGLERATAMEEVQRRVDWLDASAVVSQQLLTSSSSVIRIAQEIADHMLRLSDGRSLTIAVAFPDDPALLEIRVAAGVGSAALVGRTLPRASSLAGSVMDANRGRLDSSADTHPLPVPSGASAISRPVMAVPIHSGGGEPRGAIVVHRRPDQPAFDATDLSMAEDFARQTSLALELAEKRAVHDRQQRRHDDTAAQALHDGLLQRLFSIGMTVQSAETTLRRADDSPNVHEAETLLARAVDDLNDAIREVRSSLQSPTTSSSGLLPEAS